MYFVTAGLMAVRVQWDVAGAFVFLIDVSRWNSGCPSCLLR